MDEDTLPVGMRELMTRAIEEAARYSSGAVEGEHILLAALRAERAYSLGTAGITAIDDSRLQSSPSRSRQRPTWGASVRTLMTEVRTANRGPRHRMTEQDMLVAILRTELGTVPRALDLAGINRAALITRLNQP